MTPKKLASALIAVGLGVAAFGAHAQVSGNEAKIGYITDLPGLYANIDRQGGVEAVEMVIEDTGDKMPDKPIKLVMADHQNKAGTTASEAYEWTDQRGLDMLLDSMNSTAGLAINKVAPEKKCIFADIGAGTTRLTSEEYTPYAIHYAYDTVVLTKGAGNTMVKQGGRSWFLPTVNYAFDHSLKDDTTAMVEANDGIVIGSVKHPLPVSDFSSYLLQAQSSKTWILGLTNADDGTVDLVKATKEFGITKTIKIAGLLMFINDIHSLGLQTAEGLLMTDNWYWDMSDTSRKLVNRYFMKMKKMPSSLQIVDYLAMSNYIRAVATAGTDDSDKVIAQFKKTKIDDFYTEDYIRQDGHAIHDMYLLQVKMPAEPKRPWGYLKATATIPGEQALTTPAESKCPLMKK